MKMTRTLAFALGALLATTATTAAGLRTTAAHVWQAQALKRQLDSLTRQHRDHARQLRQLDERLALSSAGSDRLLLQAQRQSVIERQRSIESDRAAVEAALRRADLLVAVGAELEIGWLPAALQGANNGKVLPGQPGYFDGAAQIDLIETGQIADRARGDVHPLGNPHSYMDPQRMVRVARALATRRGQMEPGSAAAFAANAAAFGRLVDERVPRWKAKAQGSPGVVFFHKGANYLAALLGVPVLGFVEPLPGIPHRRRRTCATSCSASRARAE